MTVLKPSAHPDWPEVTPCKLPPTIRIIGMDIRLLRLILGSTWEANFLVGSHEHFVRLPIRTRKLMRHSMISENPVAERFLDMDYEEIEVDETGDPFEMPPYPHPHPYRGSQQGDL